MTDDVDWVALLKGLTPSEWPGFLAAHSGLPGPRANLSLLRAVVSLADPELIATLETSGDEYSVMCAAASLGARAVDDEIVNRLRVHATDDRWRVREGVAIGLQLLGDNDIASLIHIASTWANDPDPLVQRAVVVALCEPRLLRDQDTVQAALQMCRTATSQFAQWSDQRRRSPDARTLRQALGYCWSVIVAANPTIALAPFLDLDTNNPDINWIVTENKRKNRLAKILPASPPPTV